MFGETIRRPSTITQDDLLAIVDQLNDDPKIHGILVQMPLPKQINPDAIVCAEFVQTKTWTASIP